MLKRLAIVSLATLLGSAVQLSPAEFHGLSLKQEAAAPMLSSPWWINQTQYHHNFDKFFVLVSVTSKKFIF